MTSDMTLVRTPRKVSFRASESLAEIYLGDLLGGSVSTWFAYVVALAFLLIRPSGLFGR